MYPDRRDGELDAGHALIGPIEVRGALAGETLEVEIDEIRIGSGGVTQAGGWSTPLNERLGVGDGETLTLHWGLDADAGVGRADSGREVALHPFLGVIGMPPDEPGVHSTASTASLGREHRLQGARRRNDALSADTRRRRAALGGRRARGAG